ncbi:Globin-like protein [Pseudocohnilembus persalinus]|uniref:Globin-like protein n=1 Tax=Pseudocohnilembus persalinus TaxID=266149 RepID=A0A0V0R0D4_PSEPJ|nr:Globin-like protein [Pseudocohnilembus persalinus]|eukprot:KRX07637.1 Globin-like protein [Pseudocohnilembus persalinus]
MSAAVEKFYVKVLADPVVNDFFKSTDMAKQKRQQQTFLTHVLGGPNNYNGKDMRTAHEHLGIREEHFNAIATHLQNTLLELGVDKGLVNEIIAVVATTKKDILNQ